MSNSTLQKFVLNPVVLSAAVFATLTLPLALFGSKPVKIQLQEETVFQGQLQNVSTPYLGLVSLISLGAGVASVALTGWRRSTRKSSEVEAQLSNLAQSIQEKEAQLEALKLSESQLAASGLKAFLDEEVPQRADSNKPSTAQSVSQPVEAPVITPVVYTEAAPFANAQSFFGSAPAKPFNPAMSTTQLAAKEVEELNSQMEEIMAQMASVQAALSVTRTTESTAPAVSPESGKSWSVQEVVS
jgi:hypothetical protein